MIEDTKHPRKVLADSMKVSEQQGENFVIIPMDTAKVILDRLKDAK